ncbi:MAG TPA: ATP-binding protein [Methylophilaceae bacterium]|nr:ATP-binding protein [Methylophilaceae bacterium]
MGRLFWKFFFFFFLAQLTALVGVGLTIWINSRNHELAGVEASPPARSVVEAASATLEYGGVDALNKLLKGWQYRRAPQVYAVDETGRELLQRALPEATLTEATELVESVGNERYIKRIKASDGHEYLLFVPRYEPKNATRVAGNRDGDPSKESHQSSETQAGANQPDNAEGMNKDAPPPPEGMREDRPPRPRPLQLFPFKPMMAGGFVSLFFAALLAWYFSKPIKNLRKAFEEAANGHLDTRVGKAMGSRRDELADLGRDFDSMAGRIGSLLQGQTRLLHHVSHELRSPLARLQMAVGLARQSPEKIPTSLDRIERESIRMDRLVGELLELSRLESGVINIQKEKIDVNELLASVVEDAQYEADATHASAQQPQAEHPEVWLVPNAHFVLQGQPDLLHRAVENIVRNALKYSPPGGDIRLEVNHDPAAKLMSLTISDQGPGVPPGELESIFHPFVRGSTANNGDGHGVGLAIAKQVVEAHGGTIVARNRPNGGLVVEIALPYFSMRADV